MLFSEKLPLFTAAHPCQIMEAGGGQFRYVLCGQGDKP